MTVFLTVLVIALLLLTIFACAIVFRLFVWNKADYNDSLRMARKLILESYVDY